MHFHYQYNLQIIRTSAKGVSLNTLMLKKKLLNRPNLTQTPSYSDFHPFTTNESKAMITNPVSLPYFLFYFKKTTFIWVGSWEGWWEGSTHPDSIPFILCRSGGSCSQSLLTLQGTLGQGANRDRAVEHIIHTK